MSLRVDIWSDIACPWCYVGQSRFAKGAEAFGEDVEVVWHSYQLDPSLPETYEGTETDYLAERKGIPREQVKQLHAGVEQAAAGEGLPMDTASVRPANSLKAHHLLKTIGRHGGDVNAAEHKLFSAHFADGEVISDVDVLTRIGLESGLTAEQVAEGLADPSIHAEVQEDFDVARQIGVTGVPFFVFGEKYAVSGAQPPELFEQALRQTWEELKPQQKPSLINVDGGAGEACGPEGC
ncbi:DsbA family oxidoreductase [Propionibacteriaceae bacterium G1746]|uniref:DsbA family oxidoreductase n=1 Tax=Aestuariimicrobium sp. G57 TaxID=3418485 RepID=UPI003C227972